LIQLKLLELDAPRITNVPEEIAKLQYLQTLDINCGYIKDPSVLATISQQGRLVHFVAWGCNIGDEIEGSVASEVTGTITVNHQSADYFRRLGDLTNLRKLELYVCSYEEEEELARSIRKLVKLNLRSLVICLSGRPNNFLEELSLPAECCLQELCLVGQALLKVPRWMGSLVNLQKLHLNLSSACQEDLEVLGGLPGLCYISVNYKGPSSEHLKAAMETLIAAHPSHPMLVWNYDVEADDHEFLGQVQYFQHVETLVG
jgi:disease resistance protein RPM1